MGEFNEMLKQIRLKRGLSQKEVAEKLEITPASYNLYENGKRKPNIDMLKKIADFFNVDIDFLIGYTPQESSEACSNKNNEHYYYDDETRQIAQEAFKNPDLRTLFKVARDIPPERLRAHIEFMKSLKEQERGNGEEGC